MIDKIFYGLAALALTSLFLLGPGGPFDGRLAFDSWAVWTGGVFALLVIAVSIRESVR